MKGFFDFLTGERSNADVGGEVLWGYFSEAVKFPEFGFSDYDAWVSHLESKVPGYVDLIGELVKANVASTSVEGAAQRLVDLANVSGGTATMPSITAASGGRGDTINWSEALPDIASESIQDVGEIAQNVGAGVVGSLNMLKFLPIILIGGAALYIAVFAKGQRRKVFSR